MNEIDRLPAVAGSFYSADPNELRLQIHDFYAHASSDLSDSAGEIGSKGEIFGLIAPHAGYFYSGFVAAHAYKLLARAMFETVVVVAPSHREYFEGNSVYNLGAYKTPLGRIPLDLNLVKVLAQHSPLINTNRSAHTHEHSLEVQLPFLQEALGDFLLVPIIMGNQTKENCDQLAEAITEIGRLKKVLLVASTDLSHFYTYDRAVKLDAIVLAGIERNDPDLLWDDIFRSQKCEACGAGPMVTVMQAARQLGANKSKVLKYANSGDASGERNRVVGYGAAVLYRQVEH